MSSSYLGKKQKMKQLDYRKLYLIQIFFKMR
jgi:hypothetical protein